MNRRERNSILTLFKKSHANRARPTPSTEWRAGVMADVQRIAVEERAANDWERAAPRFTMAAAALSAILLVVATWSLGSLPQELYAEYANSMFTAFPQSLNSL